MISMKDKLCLLDTNILVYAYDASGVDKEKHKICKDMVSGCWNRDNEFAISLQNLSEFYVTVTKKIENPISATDAKGIIGDILSFGAWKKINFTANTILSAININHRYKIHYWDALLAATIRENNILCIYTENERDFKRIPWLMVVDPMSSSFHDSIKRL